MKEIIYKAHPEFIGQGKILDNGANTDELYELEKRIADAIYEVMKWRTDNLKEEEWTEALPQTILVMLNGWDQNAVGVAIKSFLMKKEVIKRVRK